MKQRITHYEVAAVDFLEKLHISSKRQLKHTPRENLVYYHFTIGLRIRIHYDMWNNPQLVRSTGKNHPDSASMVIIVRVWELLQLDNDPKIATPPSSIKANERASYQKMLNHYETTIGEKLSVEY